MFDASAIETEPDKLVAEARGWALALWNKVYRGLGDTQESAMHTAARLAKVPPSTIWGMRYRPPRTIDVSVYFKLKAAYVRHVESVEADIAQNLESLRALPASAARDRLVAQMEEYLRTAESPAARSPSERAGAQAA